MESAQIIEKWINYTHGNCTVNCLFNVSVFLYYRTYLNQDMSQEKKLQQLGNLQRYSIEPTAGHMTQVALQLARDTVFRSESGDRPNYKNIIILVTDFTTTDREGQIHGRTEFEATVGQARSARQDGIDIYSVGVGATVDEQELSQVSSQPQMRGSTYWIVDDYPDLISLVPQLSTMLCAQLYKSPTQIVDGQVFVPNGKTFDYRLTHEHLPPLGEPMLPNCNICSNIIIH